MKIIQFLIAAASIVSACSQGTFEFYDLSLDGSEAVPPHVSPFEAGALITLEGSSLNFSVGWNVPAGPTGAGLFGPARPGEIGPLAVDFFREGTSFFVAPDIWGRAGWGYQGTVSISGAQQAELLNGLWYVAVMTDQYPDGALRAQIPAVPEPATWVLLLTGGVALLRTVPHGRSWVRVRGGGCGSNGRSCWGLGRR